MTTGPRYGCRLCPDDPAANKFDRLKKGHPSVASRSLEHHAGTKHPQVIDWLSLKIQHEKARATASNRAMSKRRRSNVVDDSTSDRQEDMEAPKSKKVKGSLARIPKTTGSASNNKHSSTSYGKQPRPSMLQKHASRPVQSTHGFVAVNSSPQLSKSATPIRIPEDDEYASEGACSDKENENNAENSLLAHFKPSVSTTFAPRHIQKIISAAAQPHSLLSRISKHRPNSIAPSLQPTVPPLTCNIDSFTRHALEGRFGRELLGLAQAAFPLGNADYPIWKLDDADQASQNMLRFYQAKNQVFEGSFVAATERNQALRRDLNRAIAIAQEGAKSLERENALDRVVMAQIRRLKVERGYVARYIKADMEQRFGRGVEKKVIVQFIRDRGMERDLADEITEQVLTLWIDEDLRNVAETGGALGPNLAGKNRDLVPEKSGGDGQRGANILNGSQVDDLPPVISIADESQRGEQGEALV